MIVSETCRDVELDTPNSSRYKPFTPNIHDATSEESASQSLHSLRLFLYILACQSQAES